MLHHQKFAISLSGGGLSSLAYIGFVQVLKENFLEPDCYAGLSGGALLAVLIASNLTADETVKFLDHLKTFKIVNTHISRFEIIDHNKLTMLIRQLLPFKTFEQLPTPAIIFTSDLVKKKPLLLDSGDIASAIVAACSVFPILQPVKRRGLILGDGGFTVYYGAKYLHQLGIKKVIGVDVTGITENIVKGLLNAFFRQINSTISSNARYELNEWPVDLDIKITFPSPNIFSMDKKAHHLINIGRKAAEKNLIKIRKIVLNHE